MIIDITGCILMPGNGGRDCPGNGEDPEEECCCDECDYLMCCFDSAYPDCCTDCRDAACPRNCWETVLHPQQE